MWCIFKKILVLSIICSKFKNENENNNNNNNNNDDNNKEESIEILKIIGLIENI